MNLHGIVSAAIGSVNPFTPAVLRQSTGYTTAPDGTQVPSYTDTPLMVQVQAFSTDELRQLDGLNIQGNSTSIYVGGNWNGIIRTERQGGDLVVMKGQTWLVVKVLEDWPDWTRLAIVLQTAG